MRYTVLLCCLLSQFLLSSQAVHFQSQSLIDHFCIDGHGKMRIANRAGICTLEGGYKVSGILDAKQRVAKIFDIDATQFGFIAGKKVYFSDGLTLVDSVVLEAVVSKVRAVGSEVFIGTMGAGLYQYSLPTKKLRKCTVSADYINDLYASADMLWIALDDGFASLHLETKHLQKYEVASFVQHIVRYQSGLLMTTSMGFLIYYDEQVGVIKTRMPENIKSLVQLGEHLWGFSDTKCYTISTNWDFQVLFEDKFEAVQLSGSYLFWMSGKNIKTKDLTVSEILTDDKVTALYATKDDAFWAAMPGKVVLYVRDTPAQKIVLPLKIPNLQITGVAEIEGKLFVGTLGEGVFVFDLQGNFLEQVGGDLADQNNIIHLSKSGGQIWIAHLNGVWMLDPKTLKYKSYKVFLGKHYLYSLGPIDANQFLAGTSGKGLQYFNDGELQAFIKEESVFVIEKCNEGWIIGTEMGGIYTLKDGFAIKHIGQFEEVKSIIPLDSLFLIGSGADNFLISNTSINLGQFIPKQLNDIQFNANTTSDSYIYIGYENGILKLYKSFLTDYERHQIEMPAPKLFDKQIVEEKTSFKHDEHTFRFKFYPKTYQGASNISYYYRMVGLDTAWQTTNKPFVNFFRLSPGQYSFEVGLVDGSAPMNLKRFDFSISRPFYQEWWFFVLLSLGVFLAFTIILKRREQLLLTKGKREQERLKFEFDRLKSQIDPHFLFNSLNSLICLIEENPERAIGAGEKLSNLYRNILKFKDMDIIDIQEDIKIGLDYFDIQKLRFEDLVSISIAPEVYTQKGKLVPLTIQFLLENAIKHSVINTRQKLEICIRLDEGYLVIKNPILGNSRSKGAGIGLKNLSSRYLLLSEREVLIDQSSDNFCIKIPIIHD